MRTPTDDGRRVDLLENGFRYLQSWFVEPPYASGGGGSFSEQPFLSVTEFYVTPFDELVWDDPAATKVTDLRPNGRITFQLTIPDYDAPDERNGVWLSFPATGGVMSDTERHTDGILVPRGRDAQEGGGAPRALSWAAVKRQAVVAPRHPAAGPEFPMLLDPEQRAAGLYGVSASPVTWLLDREGRIAARADGAREWDGPESREAIGRLAE